MPESEQQYYPEEPQYNNAPAPYLNKKEWEFLREQLDFDKIKENILMKLMGWGKDNKNNFVKIKGAKSLLPQEAVYKIMNILDSYLNVNMALSNFDERIIVEITCNISFDIQEWLTYNVNYRIENIHDMSMLVDPIFHTTYACLRRALKGNTFEGINSNIQVMYKKNEEEKK